jgi:hypothetical protein
MHLRWLVGMLNLKFLQHLVVVFAIVLSLVAMKLNLLVVLELWLQLVELEQNLEILIVLQVKLCLVMIEQQILLGQFVLYLGQRLLEQFVFLLIVVEQFVFVYQILIMKY